MALVRQFTCQICDGVKTEVVVHSIDAYHVCNQCRVTRAAIEKKAYMDKQKLMPLEKRVAIIEEYLYDSNIVNRLRKLEIPNQQIY